MGSKSTISDLLQELIGSLASQCKADAENRVKDKVGDGWMLPPDMETSLYDWKDLHAAFSSDGPNEELLKSVKADDPGNSGDLIITNTQIDYLSTMERAFRARHTMTFPRNVAHHCSRKSGEGSNAGPLKYGVLEYLKEIKKVSAGDS